ncbi:hypothetical protein M7I_0457 [Glarea lozoyensis 74030]|uniref:Uncharacterized protein n=1 Tax=Glarea lozoyensis (strain ATCC 74030 / MF5533) TaxID=1104152 RepID=H0EDE9_GLAL7|nr:hypothetical protein M7I_0457 [Glarea lozoyensis 74030]
MLGTLSQDPYLCNSHILSLLPTNPPTESLSIGVTTKVPPTTDSLTENPKFLAILNEVMKEHSAQDPIVQGQAAAFASTSGSALGSGGMFFPQQRKKKTPRAGGGGGSGGDGAGGASAQGGAGGGGRGGWLHVSDMRAPPDYGRIAFPEDIFGSLEVDGTGQFVQDYGKRKRREVSDELPLTVVYSPQIAGDTSAAKLGSLTHPSRYLVLTTSHT